MTSNPIIIDQLGDLDDFFSELFPFLSHPVMVAFKKWAPEKPKNSPCFMSDVYCSRTITTESYLFYNVFLNWFVGTRQEYNAAICLIRAV